MSVIPLPVPDPSAADLREAHEDRMFDLYGYRLFIDRGLTVCPCAVLNIAHPDGDCPLRDKHFDCIDHARLWITSDGWRVFTSEIYGSLSTDQIVAFCWDLTALGLTMRIGGQSPYYAGETTLIRVADARAFFTPNQIRG